MQSKSLLSRILAVALCLAMVLGFVPATILSAKADAPASTATAATEAASDLLSSNLAWNKAHWDNYDGAGTGLTATKSSEEVYGDESASAWKFSASADANLKGATAQIHFTKQVDLSRHKLVMDVKYVTTGSESSASFTARMHTASWGDVSGPQAVTAIKDQWTTVSVIPSENLYTDKTISDLEACGLVTFVFDFESTTGAERAIYIDNVRTVKIETAEEDWIKLPIDVGMSNALSYGVVDGMGVSDQAMKVVTPSEEGSICFHPELGVINGVLSALPNMTSGTLSAWFYFGEAAPSAAVMAYAEDWSHSDFVDLTFESKGNGWYVGSVDCAQLNVADVIRVDFDKLPKKTTVYIDRLILDQGAIDGLSIAYPYNTETYQLTETPESRFSALTFNSARNEVESAQMILTPNFEVTSFELVMSDLVNANGNVISANSFDVFVQNYVEVTNSLNGGAQVTNPETGETYWNAEAYGVAGENGTFPNALIPQAQYIRKGENVITSGNNQGIWVNLNVDNAAPGSYTGNATLFVNGQKMLIPVEVNIYDVALSDEVHVKSSFQVWWDLLESGEGSINGTLSAAYTNYLISKRVMPYDYWGISPYDAELIPYISVVISRDPSISSYCLYNPAVAVKDEEGNVVKDENGYDVKVNDVEGMRALLNALIEEQIKLAEAGDNVDLFKKAYFYIGNYIDEPRNDEDYARVNSVTADIDALKAELAPQLDAYPELKESFMNIGHLVTGPDPLDKTFAFINAQDYGTTAMTGDSYIYCPQYQWLHTEEQRAMYADEDELWWYGCTHPVNPYPSFTINSPLMVSRALGWMMYDYDVDGILYWCVNSWGYGDAEKNFWNTYDEGTPGEGILVLPGSDYGVTGPIGTIRIENLRESLEDYEYLWLLEQFGGSIDAYVSGMYEGAIPSTDAAQHHSKRIALLEALEELNIAQNGATVIEPDLEELPQDERPESEIIKYPVDIEIKGTSTAFALQSDVTNGSEQAFVYNATSVPSHGYVYPSITLDQAYEIDKHMLIADIMIVGDSDGSNVNLSTIDDKWPEIKGGTVNSGVWQTVVFDLANNASGKTEMAKFGFGIQLPGGSSNCVVYVDNIYLVPQETAAQDWIRISKDAGMSNATTYFTPVVNAQNSSISMQVVAPADAKGKVTFNTELYFGAANCPNMTEGTLGAWFYFGDQEPSAQVQLTSGNWKGSAALGFDFVYGGDGWYYGTIDTSTIYFYDENSDGAPDGDLSKIIRISLFTPAGSTVLIDGLTFPEVEDVTPVYREDIAADWTNQPASSNADVSIDADFFYAEGSSQALKVENADEEIYLSIDVSAITPDMTTGTLGAWFYFGDAEPSATLAVIDDEGYDSAMHSDGAVPFAFGEGVDGWYYGTVDCAAILFDELDVEIGASADAISVLNITLPAGEYYIDCLALEGDEPIEPPVTEPTEPEPTDPPATEPPVTEPPVSEPSDPGDLLAEAFKADDIGIFAGGNYSWDSESTVVYGNESTKSWMIAANADAAGWPTALLCLNASYDMTGKYLEFDIKTEGGRGYIAISNVYNSGWGGLLAKDQFNIAANFSTTDGGWETVSIDLASVLGEGKDLTDVKFIRFGFDMDTNTGAERKYYIDNVRLVDEPSVDQNDIFANATYQWSASTWNDGNGLVWDDNHYEVNADYSTKSWMFGAADGIAADVGYQMYLNAAYDMDNCYFVFDGKVVGADSQQISVRPHGGETGWTDVAGPQFATLTNEWQTFMLDFSKTPWDAYATYGLANIQRLNWTFYFSQTTGDRQVIIDNVRVVKMESVEEDWINMSIDVGDSTAAYSKDMSMVKAEGSSWSMKIDATNGTTWTLNTEGYFGVDNMPNMEDGILSGYFYFGDQTPSAKIILTSKVWHGGVNLGFNFVDLGDGWYWGYLDLANYYYYADQIAAGANAEEIRRVKFTFESGAIVYVDGLKLNTKATAETEAATDLLYNTTNISYNDEQWDNRSGSGTGLTVNREYQVVSGEQSKYGWQFHAEDYANSSPTAQFHLLNSYDITGKYLLVDFKFDAPAGTSVDVKARVQNSGWGDLLTDDKFVGVAAGDWSTYIYDFSGLVKDGKDLTDVALISFTFNFVSNTGVERTLYMDNLRWVDKETVEEDWVNITRDSGAFYQNGSVGLTNEKTYGEDSSLAIKYVAPADVSGKFTLNPAAALGAAPDLSNGTLGAWFYFGDAEPAASLQFTAPWKGSIPVAFTFGEGVDGWYYGTVDTSAIEFYEEGGTMTEVNRITFMLSAGTTVFVDCLSYTENEAVCTHENTTTTTVESTCTVAGSVTITCDDCGETISTEELPLADHSYESVVTPPAVGVQGYTTHTCSVCGDSYVDSYVDPLPDEPETPAVAIKFASANMTLEADLTINFYVKPEVMNQYTDKRVEFVVAGNTLVVTEPVYDAAKGMYNYRCTGIAPKMIKENVCATLYGTFDGVEYTKVQNYSAYKYLTNQLNSSNAKLRTLAVDLLNYGTLHQQYTSYNLDNLINADLTETQKGYGTASDPALENYTNTKHIVRENTEASFKGAKLVLENAVIMQVVVQCDDMTDMSVEFVVAGTAYTVDASECEKVSGYTNRYNVYFTGLKATQFREVVEVTVYRGETAISNTLAYSVESYAYSQKDNTSREYLADLVKSIVNYGDSARAYILGA